MFPPSDPQSPPAIQEQQEYSEMSYILPDILPVLICYQTVPCLGGGSWKNPRSSQSPSHWLVLYFFKKASFYLHSWDPFPILFILTMELKLTNYLLKLNSGKVPHLENEQKNSAQCYADARCFLSLWHYPEIGRTVYAANSLDTMPWYRGNVFSIQNYNT